MEFKSRRVRNLDKKILFCDNKEMMVDMTPVIKEYQDRFERLKKLAPYIEKFGVTKADLKLLLRVM